MWHFAGYPCTVSTSTLNDAEIFYSGANTHAVICQVAAKLRAMLDNRALREYCVNVCTQVRSKKNLNSHNVLKYCSRFCLVVC